MEQVKRSGKDRFVHGSERERETGKVQGERDIRFIEEMLRKSTFSEYSYTTRRCVPFTCNKEWLVKKGMREEFDK